MPVEDGKIGVKRESELLTGLDWEKLAEEETEVLIPPVLLEGIGGEPVTPTEVNDDAELAELFVVIGGTIIDVRVSKEVPESA